MLTVRAMTGAQGYAQRHLQHSDYYDQNRSVQGEWQGRGAELLGLRGRVEPEIFERIREGLHPETGEFLRPRHSADRIGVSGETESKARSLYDLTFSAPKSVSVQAFVGGDDRLLEAHQTAVREALKETERSAGTRVRLAGANHDRTTGNLVIASYTHDSSRQLDPQLHTHAVAANLTYDGVEGRWKALQASDIYERRAYLTEVYRNTLAREVRALGYEVENQRNIKGADGGFELKGVSREVLERYSQRSEQRDAAVRQFTTEHGRPPTDNEVAVLVRDSRPDKLLEISTRQVHERQLHRISAEEHAHLAGLHEASLHRIHEHRPSQDLSESALNHAKEHLFERKTVLKEHELFTEALRHGRGEVRLSTLRGTYELEIAQGKLLHRNGHIATHASLERERAMVASVDERMEKHPPLAKASEFVVSRSLRAEQRTAVETILASRDFAINLRGAAGTGKTATLQEVHRGLQSAGREVMAVAPTRSAVQELERVGFRNAMTIARLTEDAASQRLLRGNVLIVDEAGMVSGKQMEELLALAHRQRGRILFSGDTRQIQSVESSDALRILERESRMKSVSLTGIQRQSNPEYREAIQAFRQSPQEGFERLESLGAIREVPYLERAEAVARAYREMTASGPRQVLVVAATHEEIGRITHAIRSDLKSRGALGDSVVVPQYTSLQWTEAQKKDIENYQAGQVLVFHRSSHGIEKYESLVVTEVQGQMLHTTNEKDDHHVVHLTQSRSFSVHQSQSMEVAAGDQLLLTGNRRSQEFRATNGETVRVEAVNGNGIQLVDGRTIPENYRAYTHAYAITAHRSQGKTVDSVIISADAMKQELFYVAASRGREGIAIITSDAEQLAHSIGASMARPSAIELAKQAEIAQEALPSPEKLARIASEMVLEQGLGRGR